MAKPGPKPGSKRKNTSDVAKRPVGRPPKSASKTDTQAAPKRRGRPPKSASKAGSDSKPANPEGPKRRGRIPKAKAEADQQHHNQEPEQAQSSHVQPVEAIVLEVVGTSIQPAFVIQEHGVNSPDHANAQETSADKPQGILSKVPSKKEVATAKKLAVKKTQALKKTATKKVSDSRPNSILCQLWLAKQQMHRMVLLRHHCWHVSTSVYLLAIMSTTDKCLIISDGMQAADVAAAASDAAEDLEQAVRLLKAFLSSSRPQAPAPHNSLNNYMYLALGSQCLGHLFLLSEQACSAPIALLC